MLEKIFKLNAIKLACNFYGDFFIWVIGVRQRIKVPVT
jgi:hypothetical protein